MEALKTQLIRFQTIIRFVVAGGTATLVQLIALFFFTDVLGIWYVISAILAFVLAASVSFSSHKFWTFRDFHWGALNWQFIFYLSIQVLNLGLTTLFIFLLVDIVGLWYLLAQAIISGTLAIVSFLLYKHKIFVHSTSRRMTMGGNGKVVYVLPEYQKNTATHFSYLTPFLERVARHLSVFVIVEKGERPTLEHVVETRLVRARWLPLRFLSDVWLCLVAHHRGYHDFYVHYSFTGALAAWVITLFLGGRVFYWNCGSPWLYKRGWFEERIFRFILRQTILVTGTAGIRDDYARHYRLHTANTRILPNWIDVEMFPAVTSAEARVALDIPQEKKVILFVHRLSKRKGADRIIPTAEVLHNRDALFLVVGSGPEEASVRQIIKNRHLDKQIRLVGSVPHARIHEYFSASDVFFMPSEEEGFPHVLLEAMASGTPYVASDVGGVRDISPEEERSFITEQTPAAFAHALKQILSEPLSPDTLREHVRRYDISHAVDTFTALFGKPSM